METPFSTTRTVLFPMMERGSFFLPLIFAYIPWLNLVVIPVTKHLLKKKGEERGSNNEFNTYSFFPQFQQFAEHKQKALDQGSEELESMG